MFYVIAIGLILTIALPPTVLPRFPHQGVLILFIALINYSFMVAKKTHWSVGLALFYWLGYAIIQWSFPNPFFSVLGPLGMSQWASMVAGAGILMFAYSSLSLMETKYLASALFLLSGIAAIDSLLILNRVVFNGPDFAWWLLIHPSVDGCFIAMMIPVLLHLFKEKPWSIFMAILMSAAVVLTKGSSAIAALILSVGSYFVMSIGWWALPVVFLSVLSLAFGAWKFIGPELLSNNGRFHVWELTWDYFKNSHVTIGSGPGTFMLYGPAFQILERQKTGSTDNVIFFWLHNDWFTCLFEGGIIGLTLVLLMYGFSLYRARSIKPLFPVLLTYGFIGFLQMPLHLGIFQLLGVILVTLAFN